MPSSMTHETPCAGAPAMFNTIAREIEGTPPAREAPPPPARHWLEPGQSGAGNPAAIAPRSPTPNLSPPHRNSPLVGQGGRAFHTEWPTKLRRFPPGLSQFRWHFPTSTWPTKLRPDIRCRSLVIFIHKYQRRTQPTPDPFMGRVLIPSPAPRARSHSSLTVALGLVSHPATSAPLRGVVTSRRRESVVSCFGLKSAAKELL